MRKIIIISIITLYFWGIRFEVKACSPAYTPFSEWLSLYTPETFILIEGYFACTGRFMVLRSSDPSIKVGNEYEVYEFGPFGSMCEMYESRGFICPSFVKRGANHRLLLAYKDRSINGRLVTPIFLQKGASIVRNRIFTKQFDDNSFEEFYFICLTPLDEIWKLASAGNIKKVEWIADRELICINQIHCCIDVQQPPTFPGGEEALLAFLQENMEFPVYPYEHGIEGYAEVEFVVLTDGTVTDISAIRRRTSDPCFLDEAERLVENMPKFNPGRHWGIPVNVRSVLTITFTLPQ